MSRLLTTEAPLIVLPSLARELGLEESIILQQLHYLLGSASTISQGRTWVYNTFEQWADLLPIPLARIKRAFNKLKTLGILLIEKLARWKTNRTNYYTIDYDKLTSIVDAINQTTGKQDIQLAEKQPQTLTNASVQNAPMEQRKISASISAKPADVYKDYNRDFQQRKNRESEKSEKTKSKATPPDSGLCSDQPTTPEPTRQQIDAAPRPIHELWKNLRRCKIDIALDDHRIPQWIARLRSIQLCQRAIDLHATQPSVWHSPDALTSSHDQRRAAA